MKKVEIHDDDTIGVAVQQSDLPMVQFLVNGEPMHELAINRFRGAMYPSIFLPAGENIKATLVFDENDFRQYSPHAKFGPVILATNLIWETTFAVIRYAMIKNAVFRINMK